MWNLHISTQGSGSVSCRSALGTTHRAKCPTPPQFSMTTGCTWIWGIPVRISFGCTVLRFVSWHSACLVYYLPNLGVSWSTSCAAEAPVSVCASWPAFQWEGEGPWQVCQCRQAEEGLGKERFLQYDLEDQGTAANQSIMIVREACLRQNGWISGKFSKGGGRVISDLKNFIAIFLH